MDEYEYANLEQFSLKIHGDGTEQNSFELIQADFPAYEVFWRRYVVPLTNRISPDVEITNPNWIRLRSEVNGRLEWMTMCHYSIFHHLVRAKRLMVGLDLMSYPEDVFVFLDACRENVQFFFKIMEQIFKDFGLAGPSFPKQPSFFCVKEDHKKAMSERGGFVRAKEYRNVMIHNPILVRAIDKENKQLPHWDALDTIKNSWRAAEKLTADKWISCDDLFEGLWSGISRFLQSEWQIVIDALEELRYKPQYAAKFQKYWALDKLMPIKAVTVTLRFVLPPAVSPAVSVTAIRPVSEPYSPTAVVPLIKKDTI